MTPENEIYQVPASVISSLHHCLQYYGRKAHWTAAPGTQAIYHGSGNAAPWEWPTIQAIMLEVLYPEICGNYGKTDWGIERKEVLGIERLDKIRNDTRKFLADMLRYVAKRIEGGE